MSLLILSRSDAIRFIEDRLDLDADTIVVTARDNGTYEGVATFTPPPDPNADVES